MFSAENIRLHRELLKQAEEKLALDPATLKSLMTVGATGLAVGVPAHLLTKAHEQAEQKRVRNHAFGAGMAAGVVSPHVIRNLFNIADSRGLMAPSPVSSTVDGF